MIDKKFGFRRAARMALLTAAATGMAACDDGPIEPVLEDFVLAFGAVYNGAEVGCGVDLVGLGPSANVTVELSDLRFYVSNLRFFDDAGAEVEVELDTNAFQYTDSHGSVALIDLTGTGAGACAGTGLSYPEGTARVNASITGQTEVDEVHSMSFDVGLPQDIMKHVIADHTEAGAPSPLAEMHWSWAYAYRHLVMNFTVDMAGTLGEGYLHVGSTDCGGDGTRAMTDRTTCGRVNTPTVEFDHFHLDDMAALDLGALLNGLDFMVDQGGGGGMVPGVATHSSDTQPHTAVVFGNLGISTTTGAANAALNSAFVVH